MIKTKNIPRLLEKYRKEIVPQMVEKFVYKNKMQVPYLEKVVINIGVGDGAREDKVLDQVNDELTLISGQKCIKTKARKSISDFKIRKGMFVGSKVTLRKAKMYEFLDRLINIALPRIKDFHGLRDSFNKCNYNLGIKEQIIFPEIDYDKVDKIRGMNITIVVSKSKEEEARELLRMFGMPFKKSKIKNQKSE